MKVDITSMFFNSKIEGKTATPAWGTSIGQNDSRKCRIDDFRPEVVEMVIGMTYKSVSERDKLDISAGSSDREVITCSLFHEIFINKIKIDDSQFVLLLVREHSKSHDGRLIISYAPYITYNGISNQSCIDKMQEAIGCSPEGCWFVHDISIQNQSQLHFSATIVNPDHPMEYRGITSKQRSLMWRSMIPSETIETYQPFQLTSVIANILSTGLIYSDTLIKRLAYSLLAKPFVILSGLAGSGKTQLALAFAKCMSENIEEQVCTVSIGADWTNREPLLGYPNALRSGEYVMPESGVLQLLMRAEYDPTKPYFLILDEMNLSVVERYFADFLSAMESGEKIKLWDGGEDVPAEISLPKNVFIIGTINVDETTYMFSPKVLDRANVIEFKIAPEEMKQYLDEKKDIHLEKAYSACADMAVDFVEKAKSQIEIKNGEEKDILLSFFKELKQVNAEFGYRTVNEICRYLHFSGDDKDGLQKEKAIDTAILQKLLPKLHGSKKKLVTVLTAMWKLCLKDGVAKEIDAEYNVADFKYPESAEKIQRMYHAVVYNGFTSFAEA
ncbi:MAG: hypothetical protein IJK84_05210 [Bacteroidales bacterium]|nr:hypothetical protein [Bacteroidales bacterium]